MTRTKRRHALGRLTSVVLVAIFQFCLMVELAHADSATCDKGIRCHSSSACPNGIAEHTFKISIRGIIYPSYADEVESLIYNFNKFFCTNYFIITEKNVYIKQLKVKENGVVEFVHVGSENYDDPIKKEIDMVILISFELFGEQFINMWEFFDPYIKEKEGTHPYKDTKELYNSLYDKGKKCYSARLDDKNGEDYYVIGSELRNGARYFVECLTNGLFKVTGRSSDRVAIGDFLNDKKTKQIIDRMQ